VAESLADAPIVAVVDDDPSVLRAVRSLLLSSGFRVRAFSAGSDFLAWPELTAVSCLVLDLIMPEMSGFDVVADLRATQRLMPVVVLTASADHGEVEQKMLESGAVACLRKPASGPELLGAVRNAIRNPTRAECSRDGTDKRSVV
jgi:two-component system response regulator FixJ